MLPYLGSISHRIEKEPHQYIKTHLPDSKLRFIHNTNKLKQQFLVKDPQRQLTRTNVVRILTHLLEWIFFYRTNPEKSGKTPGRTPIKPQL